METDQPSDDPSAAAAAYPRWVLLEDNDECRHGDPDVKTVAHALTSKGRPISVSCVLAAPPAVSHMRLHTSGGLPDGVRISSYTVAAHGDSVLVNVETRIDNWNHDDEASDYFLYREGDAAADPFRPPSLSLLPPCYRYMHSGWTAILRRVAALGCNIKDGDKSRPLEAELCVLR